MKSRLAWLLLASLLPLSASAVARYAVLVGSDEGASGRPRLWYATQDAHRFAATLTELGDFPRDQVVVLESPRLTDVRRALATAEARVSADQKTGERGLILFYFSGHANEHGLELGSDELPYEELRRVLTDSQSKARIAVVDACHSGTLTHAKGGVASKSVNFALPYEEVEGVAFLASSSAGEQAQESTVLKGSFFTSHLEAAMRGAGDMDGDRRVTLSEAFFYTSTHTSKDTELTQAGPQHPTYDPHLSGRGDVILADLRRAEATVTLPESNGASWTLRGPGDFLANVPDSGKPQEIALNAGEYTVERVAGDYAEVTELSLSRGDQKPLPPLSPRGALWGMTKGGHRNELGLGLAFVSGILNHNIGGFTGQLSVARAVGPVRLRLRFDGGRQSMLSTDYDYDLSRLGGALGVLLPVIRDPVRLEVGAQGGADWLSQDARNAPSRADSKGFAGRAELLVDLSYPIGLFRLGMEMSGGAQFLSRNYVLDQRFFLAGSMFGGWEF